MREQLGLPAGVRQCACLELPARMKRPRFFDGQLLSAKDFEAEQQYHIEKRRLHNRMLLGFGVVDGLAVSVDDGTGAALIVSPGFALDRCGNEILVDGPVRIDPGICTGHVCFVTIEFTETDTDPVPSINGGEQFSRVTEGYAVRISGEDPSESANASQLGLARLICVKGNWVVDETYCRQTL
jgi:hypothetical protein